MPIEVGERIGTYYVYLLVDPRDNHVFYVGKGTGQRLLAHGVAADLGHQTGESQKTARIRAIRASGLGPIIEVVRHELEDPSSSLRSLPWLRPSSSCLWRRLKCSA